MTPGLLSRDSPNATDTRQLDALDSGFPEWERVAPSTQGRGRPVSGRREATKV